MFPIIIRRFYPLTTAQIKYAEHLSRQLRHNFEEAGEFDISFADPYFLPYNGRKLRVRIQVKA